MRQMNSGGGWPAILYTLKKARSVGGLWKMYSALRTKNACKTCALGMGGQKGGMVNEIGGFPEVCKKSLQAMAADMQAGIPREFYSTYSIQQLEKFTPKQLEDSGRIAHPLFHSKGDQYYQIVSWDDALGEIADALKQCSPDESYFYFSGRSSNEAGFLLQLLARVYGTNNVNNCSYYCHQASGVGLNSSVGSGTATIQLEDLEKADLVFVIGGNPPSNHPRIMTSLMHVRNKNGKVIVVNPVIETGLVKFRIPSSPKSLLFGTKIATQYVQPHIGGDLAMLTGIQKRILEMGTIDEKFISENCNDWELLKNRLEEISWEEILNKSRVSKEAIDEMAETYSRAKRVVFSWTMGITHHAHGVQNVQAIANLALMRGMVGKKGCGLMPIRGHSNVQGIGSVGVTPALKKAVFDSLESRFQMKLPTSQGMDTMACMEASKAGKIKVAFCLGGNLYGSNPDSKFAKESFAEADLVVYLNTTLNTGHAHGLGKRTMILPVLARDEELQSTTQESMFNFVRLSDGGPERIPNLRSEVQVIAELGRRVFGDEGVINWESMEDHGQIRSAIANIIPGYEKIETIGDTKEEFQIGGRTFHNPKFATENGKANLYAHYLPDLKGDENHFRMMSVRSEGQFNTVVYEETDIYREQDRRDVILMNPSDVNRLNLKHDQIVTVKSDLDKMPQIRVRAFDRIKEGNVLMYYPECNVLIPRTSDPKSRTPAYKGVLVSIQA